jgi:hypothetical protein
MKAILLPLSLGAFLVASMAMGDPSVEPCSLRAGKTPKYVGAKACKKCHSVEYKTWKKTKMAKSFEVLRPGNAVEAKKKAKLDPQKDFTKDKDCLRCHTTGFGKPGGYAIPPEGDSPQAKKLQKLAKARQGVQCEACHGPGSLSSKYKKKNEEYKWADLEKKKLLDGVLFPDKKNCLSCHNEDSPTLKKSDPFDFEKKKHDGMHKRIKMDFDHACPHKHTVSKKKKKKKKTK